MITHYRIDCRLVHGQTTTVLRKQYPCDGIIVVEAAQKSGALITADLGMEQGKNIFAIPGNIYSDMSRGCHKIIKEGAKLVENIEKRK